MALRRHDSTLCGAPVGPAPVDPTGKFHVRCFGYPLHLSFSSRAVCKGLLAQSIAELQHSTTKASPSMQADCQVRLVLPRPFAVRRLDSASYLFLSRSFTVGMLVSAKQIHVSCTFMQECIPELLGSEWGCPLQGFARNMATADPSGVPEFFPSSVWRSPLRLREKPTCTWASSTAPADAQEGKDRMSPIRASTVWRIPLRLRS